MVQVVTMVRIDLQEPYAIRMARESVRDSLRAHGEECILVHMFHVAEVQDKQPRCPVCYDDVYKQGERFDCPECFGTTFQGGINQAFRAWGMFGDSADTESFNKRGMWHPIARTLHTEHFPDMWQRDYVVRVTQWSADHRPLGIEGIYVLKEVANETLRTGPHFGQAELHAVGQRADLQKISDAMPIHNYPVIGKVFNRFDGRPR